MSMAISIEVSRLAVMFQKSLYHQTPARHWYYSQFCVAYSTSTGSVLFKQYFHKSCETYQLTNQTACLLKPTKFLIWLVYTKPSFLHNLGLGLKQRIIFLYRQGHTIANRETSMSMIIADQLIMMWPLWYINTTGLAITLNESQKGSASPFIPR